jgi:uncharacterized membrane protein
MTMQRYGESSLPYAARDQHRASSASGDPLAIGLGVFSIGLGLAELATTREFAHGIGMPDDADHAAVLRVAGLREVATGVAILTQKRPAALLWSRVAGDVMDLLLLGRAARASGSDPAKLSLAAGAVLGVTALDLLAAARAGRGGSRGAQQPAAGGRLAATTRRLVGKLGVPTGHVQVSSSITVNKSRAQVYAFWRKLSNLPTFMSHLESVEQLSGTRSHWKVKAPLGGSVEWDAEISEERQNELLSWRSLEGADVRNEGTVRFVAAPGGRATEVKVDLSYQVPGGPLAATFAKLFGEEPGQQVRSDLRRFKQVMETGEVLHSDASVHRGAHAAQPSEKPLQREGKLLTTQPTGAHS